MRLGFVGTGTMGNPMARCLLDAGHQLTVHDLRRGAASNLCDLGAKWADTPRAVAQTSEAVFTSLPGPAEVEKVILDPSTGILAGLGAGGACIDMTTNSPRVVRRIADVCRARGVEFLDSPVSGRPPAMTVMVGGPATTFDRYRPVLEAMGRNIFYVGETGAGCIAKLVTQYLGYTNFVTSLEGLVIAAKAGIDLGILSRIVPVSAGASRTFDNIPRSVLSGEFTAGGTLDIVAKDLHLACELAREVGAPAHLGSIADDVMKRAQARGWGQHGFPIAARVLEAMAGVELRAAGFKYEGGYQATDPRRGEPQRSPGTMTDATDDIAHLVLQQKIENFLYHEAELLDERRYEDWLGLLAEDVRYWMPIRRNVKVGELEREFTREGQDVNWFDEGKDTLTRRVQQILTGVHWAEEPLSRICHIVSNVQILDVKPSASAPSEVTVKSRFLIYRNRVETETDILVGKREDVLHRIDGQWKIRRRKIVLDQNVLLSKNLTFFF